LGAIAHIILIAKPMIWQKVSRAWNLGLHLTYILLVDSDRLFPKVDYWWDLL
jgi:hypothetical protein